jgi:hypothetical protein
MNREERMRQILTMHWWCCLAVPLFLVACHDTPRKNPFDPELTPAVELSVALDDTAGTAMLMWTPYAGKTGFAEYRVLRNIAKSTEVDTLAAITTIDSTAYVDTGLEPDTAYEYRVAVTNDSGFEVASAHQRVDGYTIRAVHLLPLEYDSEAGMVHLTWTRYRNPGFEGYQVYRRQMGMDADSLINTVADQDDTTFTDRTARHEIDYVYRVVVAAPGRELTSNGMEGQLVLPAVQGLRVNFDSHTATATLEWAGYRGAGFRLYQVRRHTAEEASHIIYETLDNAVTFFTDSSLVGATEYSYQVIVVTERGEEVPSLERSGGIHMPIATWPLPGTHVELAAEPDGRIAALVSIPEGDGSGYIRLFFFEPEGLLVEKQELLFSTNLVGITPAVSMGRGADGRRFFSHWEDVLAFTQEGEPIWQEHELFAEAFPEPLQGVEGQVLGTIGLMGDGFYFDNVEMWSGNEQLFDDDFSHWPEQFDHTSSLPEWSILGADFEGFTWQGKIILEDKRNEEEFVAPPLDGSQVVYRRVSPSSLDFLFEGNLVNVPGWWQDAQAAFQIGGDTFSRFLLVLRKKTQDASLEWVFSPPPGQGLESKVMKLTDSLPYRRILPSLPHRVSMEILAGQPRFTIAAPILWGGVIDVQTVKAVWRRLTVMEDRILLTADHLAYSIDASGTVTEQFPFDGWVNDIRVWDVADAGNKGVGVCLPEENKLLLGIVPRLFAKRWAAMLTEELGPFVGGEMWLNYPLSFAVGPDGRIYVLDGGNARIVVFDSQRNYLTHWGVKGSEVGMFDFGDGRRLGAGWNFRGSLCVDDDGFIYVADMGNRRIQKFAP